MEFSRDLRPRVLSGQITVSFRLWRRPKVKVGGRYPVDDGQIEVDSIEVLPFAAVTAADLRRSGEPDRDSLRRRTAHAGPVHDDTLVFRIEFHLVKPPAETGLLERPREGRAAPVRTVRCGTTGVGGPQGALQER